MDTTYSTNRNFRRLFVNILSIVVILTMAFPVTGAVSAQEPAPFIRISTSNDYLQADNFTPNTLVTFTAYASQGSSDVILEISRQTDETGLVFIDGWEHAADLVAGNYIVATDGNIEKQLVLQPLTMEVFDPVTDLITGTATPGQSVWVLVGNNIIGYPGGMWVVTDNNGLWTADFSSVFNFTDEMWGGAVIYDDDSDFTVYHLGPPPPPPSPWLRAHPEWESVDGWYWPLGAELHLTIEDPNTITSPDLEMSKIVDVVSDPPDNNSVWFDFAGVYDLKSGDEVTLTDGITTRSLVVSVLSIDTVDIEADTVAGIAEPGVIVRLPIPGEFFATTDSDGNWDADFAAIGLNVSPGMTIIAEVYDEDDSPGDLTSFELYLPNPWLIAFPENDAVEGLDWPVGESVTLTIDNAPGLAWEGVPEARPWGDTHFRIDFSSDYNLKVGDVVTLTDAFGTSTTHEAQPLAITGVDMDTDIVSGTANAGALLQVWVHGQSAPPVDIVTANDGTWQADLTDVYDITYGTGGRSQIMVDGNATAVDWSAPPPPPSPFFRTFPDGNSVDGGNWPLGAIVHMTIDDPLTLADPDYELDAEVTTSDQSWTSTYVNFDFNGAYDLKRGDKVTLTSGGIQRELIVPNLWITTLDVENNIVGGTFEGAESGATVHVFVGGDANLYVTTNPEGAWIADFDDIGFDLLAGTGGKVEVADLDEFGNSATFDWYIPNPHFTVFPEWEWFDGWDWTDGTTVTITVADKPECKTTKESWNYFFNGSFGDGCDVVVGDVVTFTDGETIRTHTVRNLAITKANHEDDIVKGTADAGAEIHVWPHATGQEQLVTANPQGKWNVDFAGIYDLMRGDGGRAEIRDEAGNATAVDWYIPNPRIVASITEDWFYLQEFTPNKEVSFTVYKSQGGKPIWKGTATIDGSGFAWIEAEGRWDLEPGNYLVVKDGQNTKDLIIEGLTFDVFNLSNGQLSGTAPSGRNVWVGIGWQDQDAWTMNVTADSGMWLADFGQPVSSDYWWVASQIFDSDGDASELRPDRIVDLWVAAYTYDAGTWIEGPHSYHFEAEWNGGSESTPEVFFDVVGSAPSYNGYVLLRGLALRANVDGECPIVDPQIRPNQLTRFHNGYVTEYPMTYSEALDYFDGLSASAVWDDGQSAGLVRREIIPFREDGWFQYVCTFTADLTLANQPDWVDSKITVNAGQTYTIEAFGLMNPCSDTYPNGADYCIFYTPLGADGVVPYENEFGIFPGPGLRFMALLGRIGDGEPFYVGAGGTFTTEQSGTLWFTPNDNLRTDNQGAYSVLVWLSP